MSGEKQQNWLLARPEVSVAQAAELAQERYGAVGKVREAGSQQDRNFIVHDVKEPLLLKINNPVVGKETAELMVAAAEKLAVEGVATPRVLATLTGEKVTQVSVGAGETAQVLAFELLNGDSFVTANAGFTGVEAQQLGQLAGSVVAAFADFEHSHSTRNLQWELSQAATVVAQLLHTLPAAKQEFCNNKTTAAAKILTELQAELPQQIIHADITGDNVMRGSDGKLYVIDLGDVCRSYRVAELAVLLADVLGATGDLALVGRAVRGFAAKIALTDAEFAALWPLVVLRGAVLAVSGYSQLLVDPDNDYAASRMEHEWRVFELAAAQDYEEITAFLRLAAGKAHKPQLAYKPLLPGIQTATVIDLSVTSPHLQEGNWFGGEAVENSLAVKALQTSQVALLRFGEARLTRAGNDVLQSYATKTRFVELVSRAGVPVYAPCEATAVMVSAAQNNAVALPAIELRFSGAVLRLDGVCSALVSDKTQIAAGQLLGYVIDNGAGYGAVRITRRAPGVETIADTAAGEFGVSGSEYEASWALDPSPILGVLSAPDVLLLKAGEQRRRDAAMGSAAERYYADPPQIERGWGARLFDTEARPYLDLVNNVTAIGHSHPRLARAVQQQMQLLNTNSRFLYRAYADFTELLLEHSPSPELDSVIPVNSGSEAVDLALKLARAYTGRKHIIALKEAYHGWTYGADAVSTSAYDNPYAAASRPDWVHLVSAPNDYRGEHRGQDAAQKYAAEVAATAAELLAADKAPAAFISESVLGNAGGVVPPAGYLQAAYAAIRKAGGVAIADEVQVGYGRLGTAFWGCEMQGAVPDIIAVAKAAGNAFPFGAVLTRREILDALVAEGMFFSSAAGAPVSAVAGRTVLEVIRDENLQQNAAVVGAHLQAGLAQLAQKYPAIGKVHGSGLYLGIELVADSDLTPATELTAKICNRFLAYGMIVQPTSERQNVLKMKPPMVLSKQDAESFLFAFEQILAEFSA